MPTYNFRNKETSEEFEKFMSISAREVYLQENPNIETMISGAPMVCDPVRVGVRKKDAGFNEVLQKIHSRSPASQLKQNNAW